MMKNAKHQSINCPGDLYTADELLKGFDPAEPMSYLETWDFKTFRQFVVDGGAAPNSLEVRRMQADHDSYISDALRRYLLTHTRLVGIMGGHSLFRTDAAYLAVARLTHVLTQKGFLVVSGGGPGAMEAAHLGAAFSNSSKADFDEALKELAKIPILPRVDDILNSDGTLKPGGDGVAAEAHQWLCAAFKAMAHATKPLGSSLAIPTWLYGQEPTTPFASSYAKYFQNSIREEALVSDARAGVIYAQGGGGTLREVFEDLEQNYYAKNAVEFTPMIFFDPDQYWEKDAQFDEKGQVKTPGIKINETIRNIIRFARSKRHDADACWEKVRFTTNIDEILQILHHHAPTAVEQLNSLLGASTLTTDLAGIGIKRVM